MVKSLATLALALMAFTATPGSAQVEIQRPQSFPPGSLYPPGYAQVFSETGCNGVPLWPNAPVNIDQTCNVCWTPEEPFNSVSLTYSTGGEPKGLTIACQLFYGVNCTFPDTSIVHVPDGVDEQCSNVTNVVQQDRRSIQCCAYSCGSGCSGYQGP